MAQTIEERKEKAKLRMRKKRAEEKAKQQQPMPRSTPRVLRETDEQIQARLDAEIARMREQARKQRTAEKETVLNALQEVTNPETNQPADTNPETNQSEDTSPVEDTAGNVKETGDELETDQTEEELPSEENEIVEKPDSEQVESVPFPKGLLWVVLAIIVLLAIWYYFGNWITSLFDQPAMPQTIMPQPSFYRGTLVEGS